MQREHYDVVVVGGGFFGIVLALEARRYKPHVLLVEAEHELMLRSSYVNQARIHQGYHYPRSLLTAERSRINFPLFTRLYPDCVVSDFRKLYAVARQHSKISAAQFKRFCERIGAPLAPAPPDLAKLFDPNTIEAVFSVEEYAFDALKLRHAAELELTSSGVEVLRSTQVTRVRPGPVIGLDVASSEGRSAACAAAFVFNATYANLNHLLAGAGLERIPLKHEFVELALVHPPPPLDKVGITLMDGPFFSCMPFPPARAHSLTHVRYTPHESWTDGDDHLPWRSRRSDIAARAAPTLFRHMVRDAARYVPLLRDAEYVGSIREVKTLLPQSERDDSRPILFRPAPAAPHIVSVLGAKIDNVLDIRESVRTLLA